jgi:phytanoyl-CoA hydroxylase
VDEGNGCVRYVRGSHAAGLRPHGPSGVLGFSRALTDWGSSRRDAEDEVAMPAAPGDALAHHALTVHRADANASPTRSRRALGFIYYAADAVEDVEAKAAYQAALARALREAGAIA